MIDYSDNPAGYPADVWQGKRPACRGSDWVFPNGQIITADKYETWFGSFEIVQDIMARGTFFCSGTVVSVFGLSDPYITITNPKSGPLSLSYSLSSRKNPPDEIEQALALIIKDNPNMFNNRFGALFLSRVDLILSYKFPLKKYMDFIGGDHLE